MSHRSEDAWRQHADNAASVNRRSPSSQSRRRSPRRYESRRSASRDEDLDDHMNGRSDSRSDSKRRRYDDKRHYHEEHKESRHHHADESIRPARRLDERREQRDNLREARPASDAHRRRSKSPPDFVRDRTRERSAYDRRYGLAPDVIRSPSTNASAPASTEPDFAPSGLLAQESNSKNGVTLKYFEPPEARKPKKKWRLYVFKDGKEVDMLHISRQSCYLMGRDHAVADIPIDHPSVSKQHAVVQYRNLTERNEYGDETRSIKPFLIDLDSANGCIVNGKEVPPSRYYELKNGDTIKLGGSQREYVLLAEEG